MAEQDKPFVVNDRRKFRMNGELREPSPEKPDTGDSSSGTQAAAAESGAKVIPFGDAAANHREQAQHEAPAGDAHATGPIPINSAHTVTPVPQPDDAAATATSAPDDQADANLPPPPTPEEVAQVQKAYNATAERLDTMMRATNPGAEHLPPMDFTRMVQSIYMSAMMQLGAGTPQGEQARVDLLGAKQSIDMLGVIAAKTETGLDPQEKRLIESALFELQMGFLEITQMLARQATARQGAPGAPSFGAGPAGPRIVS